jgi:hypothetical protein
MYVLMCNQFPFAVSENKNILEEKRAFLIERLANDENLEILNRTEKTISYHDGISYIDDEYNIFEVPVI